MTTTVGVGSVVALLSVSLIAGAVAKFTSTGDPGESLTVTCATPSDTGSTGTDADPSCVQPGQQGKGNASTSTAPTTASTTAPTTNPPTTTAAPATTAAPPRPAAPATRAAPALPPPPAASSGGGAGLLWSDEFNGGAGAGVDPGKWELQSGAPTNGGRVECDMPGTHNAALDGNGNLTITARRENVTCAGGVARNYTSARLEGTPATNFVTGYLEVRAKLSTWGGTVPTLWTYGASGYDPSSQFIEADLVEMRTLDNQEPRGVHQTIHSSFANNNGDNLWALGWSQNMPSTGPSRVGDAWHTFGEYVNPADHSVTMYFDGRPYGHYSPGQPVYSIRDQVTVPAGNWPFGNPAFAQRPVIEIEMGFFSGGYLDPSRSSDTMTVDYIRAYDRLPF